MKTLAIPLLRLVVGKMLELSGMKHVLKGTTVLSFITIFFFHFVLYFEVISFKLLW